MQPVDNRAVAQDVPAVRRGRHEDVLEVIATLLVGLWLKKLIGPGRHIGCDRLPQ